ncbi:MAG: hypothetical protein A2516_01820 [Alphaproteobacteria bacterium RIFOXYD12_FULL_60_8]|nr:MAG: hypothetical protein A2516_01820 [Alphaproteobacteria bacterium RIFOXYD12_FULL_60_8]
MGRTLIIGVGNRDRGDDAFGLLVIDGLREASVPDLDLFQSHGDAAELMNAWAGYDRVVVIDVCRSGAPTGTIFTFPAQERPLPASLSSQSTHGFGLVHAVEMARALGRLPKELTVYAVEGGNFTLGEPPSAIMRQAAGDLMQKFAQRSF